MTFTADTPLPDTQCTPFAPADDNMLEGTHDLEVMIDSAALPPGITTIAPDSLTVTITDDEAECKILEIHSLL